MPKNWPSIWNLWDSLGRTLRNRVFGHMRTVEALISLRIRAVWSGSSLSAKRVVGYCRMYERRATARLILCACAGRSETAQVWRHFALDAAYFILVHFIPFNVIQLSFCMSPAWCTQENYCSNTMTSVAWGNFVLCMSRNRMNVINVVDIKSKE